MNRLNGPLLDYHPQRIATGPESVRAAVAIKAAEDRRNHWPFIEAYGPPGAIRRTPEGVIGMPMAGAVNQAIVLEFAVDSGFIYVLRRVLLTVLPDSIITTGLPGPGSFTFSIDRNTPLGGGALQGGPLADWSAINFPYGSISHGPEELAYPEIFAPEDIVRVKIINNTASAGAPNFAVARFDGYLIDALGRK